VHADVGSRWARLDIIALEDCRHRELAAGRPCPRNKHSAAKKIYSDKRNPKNNLKNNPKSVLTDVDWAELHARLITNNEKFVLLADDINKTKTIIFTCMRGKDCLTITEKYAYNLETLRIRHAGGDTSQRKIYMLYFGTTLQRVDQVSL